MNEFLSRISAPRLHLELLNIDHAPKIMEARIESFQELKKWDIFAPETSADLINIADELKVCEWRIDRVKRRESLFYSIFLLEGRSFLGCCSLTQCDWNENKAMLGFWLRTSKTGYGYAAEAAEKLLMYGVNEYRLKVYSMHAAGNKKSRDVLLRLGFKETSTNIMRPHLPTGKIDDEVYYEY